MKNALPVYTLRAEKRGCKGGFGEALVRPSKFPGQILWAKFGGFLLAVRHHP
jgi:hypothetical protein